jgi:hypothetical protein
VPPFWSQTSGALRQAAREPVHTSRVSYAAIASTIALILSASTFYFTYFRVRHSLEIVAAPQPSFSVIVDTFYVSADLVLLNDGNRTETVLRAYPEISKRTHSASATYANLSLQQGPWVLKPGDAVPIHIEWPLTPHNLQIPSRLELKSIKPVAVSVNIVVVNQDGTVSSAPVQLGILQYSETNGAFRFDRNAELDARPMQQLLRRRGA